MRLKKPNICAGCPLGPRSKWYVPDQINHDSEVLLLGQNPGKNEVDGHLITHYEWSGGKRYPQTTEVKPQPLIGATGYNIKEQFWPLVDINESFDSVSKANVIKCQMDDHNTLPPLESRALRLAALHCMSHLFTMPHKAKYVLAMGQLALWHTTRQKSVEDWRGYALPYGLDADNVLSKSRVVDFYFDQTDIRWHTAPIVMPTFHPAALFKGQFNTEQEAGTTGGNKRFMHATYHDFKKFGQLIRGEWPQPLPVIKHNEVPKQWPDYASFDTEYGLDDHKVYMWSLADRDGAVYVVDHPKLVNQRIGDSSQSGGITLIAQNLLADVNHLNRLIDIRKILVIEDTMFAHSVLWTGEPHSLDYILSIYGKFNRHKHLGNIYAPDDVHDIDVLYAGLDAYTTLHHAWKGMLKEFRLDKKSWKIYRDYRLPLAYLIGNSETKGIKVDKKRLQHIATLYERELVELQQQARNLTHDEYFNLASFAHVSREVYREVYD